MCIVNSYASKHNWTFSLSVLIDGKKPEFFLTQLFPFDFNWNFVFASQIFADSALTFLRSGFRKLPKVLSLGSRSLYLIKNSNAIIIKNIIFPLDHLRGFQVFFLLLLLIFFYRKNRKRRIFFSQFHWMIWLKTAAPKISVFAHMRIRLRLRHHETFFSRFILQTFFLLTFLIDFSCLFRGESGV